MTIHAGDPSVDTGITDDSLEFFVECEPFKTIVTPPMQDVYYLVDSGPQTI